MAAFLFLQTLQYLLSVCLFSRFFGQANWFTMKLFLRRTFLRSVFLLNILQPPLLHFIPGTSRFYKYC